MFRSSWGHHQMKQIFLIIELLLSILIRIYTFVQLSRFELSICQKHNLISACNYLKLIYS
jgi:hypothetical protein